MAYPTHKSLGLLVASVVCFILTTTAMGADEPKKIILIGSDLSTWNEKSGDWFITTKAKQDPNNEKKIITGVDRLGMGSNIIVNGKTGRTRNLLSKPEHGDVEAHIEFMVPKGSNSGVYFQGRYEIQILDSWGVKQLKHGDCGGIYQRWKKGKGFEGHPPRINASLEPGKWQTFDIVFQAPRFDSAGKKTANAKFVKVVHNGKVVHENVELSGPTRASTFNDEKPTGPLMLQGDHGPVAFRNLWLKPLNGDD